MTHPAEGEFEFTWFFLSPQVYKPDGSPGCLSLAYLTQLQASDS